MTDNELKELVASLAQEHKKTEAAQQKTEAIIASLGEEHKKTEAAQQKTEAVIASLGEEHKKTEAAQQKTEAVIASLGEEHKKTEAAQQKTEEAMIDLKRTIKETNKQLGAIGNVQGETAEDLFRRNLKSMMRNRGIILDQVEYKLRLIGGHEYDLVGINGSLIVLVEVKNKLSQNDIEKLIKEQIFHFRQDFPDYQKHSIIGAVGGMVVKDEIQKFAESHGLYVLTQKGEDGAEVVNSPEFKAKIY